MTTATKPKAKSAKTKPKRKPRKAPQDEDDRPPLFERLMKGLEDFRRHLQGEDVGVITTVYIRSGVVAKDCIAKIKAAREAAGLTLAQAAARCKLRVDTLSRLESGKVPNPTVDTLAKYAAAVGYTLNLTAVPTPLAVPPKA